MFLYLLLLLHHQSISSLAPVVLLLTRGGVLGLSTTSWVGIGTRGSRTLFLSVCFSFSDLALRLCPEAGSAPNVDARGALHTAVGAFFLFAIQGI